MAEEVKCPECGTIRTEPTQVCPKCGAPAIKPGEHRQREEEIRTNDLEPYVALRYVARMFKVLAVLVAITMVAEIVLGLIRDGMASLTTVVPEFTQLLVVAGVMWAGGDVMMLLIDLGHDIRVSRILLGRINATLHRKDEDEKS